MRRTFPENLLVALALAVTACDPEEACESPTTPRLGCSGFGCNENGENLHGARVDGGPLGVARRDLAGLTAGNELTLTLGDGRTLVATVARSVIDDRGLTSYVLTVEDHPLCGGDELGRFVRGSWDESGARFDALSSAPGVDTTFSCSDGAIAKCVAWGYDPEHVGAAMHAACTRMVRADYCGDGTAYTKDGTPLAIQDARGVHDEMSDPDLAFEAAWTADGALCVSEPRYHEMVDGDEELPSCWASLPRCDSFADAVRQGAELANASDHDVRNLCEPR